MKTIEVKRVPRCRFYRAVVKHCQFLRGYKDSFSSETRQKPAQEKEILFLWRFQRVISSSERRSLGVGQEKNILWGQTPQFLGAPCSLCCLAVGSGFLFSPGDACACVRHPEPWQTFLFSAAFYRILFFLLSLAVPGGSQGPPVREEKLFDSSSESRSMAERKKKR